MSLRAEFHKLFIDLKAAVRIGHPDSVLAALDGLRAFPGVAANQALEDPFLEQVILPLGRVLAESRLDEAILNQLYRDPLTAYRALAAIALGLRQLSGARIPKDLLGRVAQDRRVEVGRCVALSLGDLQPANLEEWKSLVETWLAAPSPRLRRTGLWVIERALQQSIVNDELALFAISWLEPYGSERDDEIRQALKSLLVALAEVGQPEAICDLLVRWITGNAEPDEWVITQTLSAGCTHSVRSSALAVLDLLEARVGGTKAIRTTRQSIVDNYPAKSYSGS